jgi:hypothetical protein
MRLRREGDEIHEKHFLMKIRWNTWEAFPNEDSMKYMRSIS